MTVLVEFATGEKFADYAGLGIDRGLMSFEYDRGMSCFSITGQLGNYQSSYKMRVVNSDGRFDSRELRESWKLVRVEVRKDGVLHTVCHVRKATANERYLEVEFDGLAKQLDKKICSVYPDTVPFLTTRGRVRRAIFGTVYSTVYPFETDGSNIDFDFGDAPILLDSGPVPSMFKNNLGYEHPYELSHVCNGLRIVDDDSVEEIEKQKYGAFYAVAAGTTINAIWEDVCTRASATDYVAPIVGHASYGIDGSIAGGIAVTDLTTTYADVAAKIGATLDCALVERSGTLMFVPLGAIIDAPYTRSIGREIKLGVNEGEISPLGLGVNFEDYTNEGFLEGQDLAPGNEGPFKYPSRPYLATVATPPHVSYLTDDYYKIIVPSIMFAGGVQQDVANMQSELRQSAPRIIECQVINGHDLGPGDGVRVTYPRFDIGTDTPWLVLSQTGDLLIDAVKFILYRTIEGATPT